MPDAGIGGEQLVILARADEDDFGMGEARFAAASRTLVTATSAPRVMRESTKTRRGRR